MEKYVHLHVHSQYSILDGQAAVPKLVDKALRDGMPGMALTDHGNMMGIKEFFNYVGKLKGKAKGALAEAEAKLAEAQPAEQEELRRTIEKQQRILAFKPIFGCEMYVARRGKALKETREDQSGWHLVVLAKNELGYHNLIKLVSRAWTDGFYMRPRTDHEDLERYKEGLIVSSACLGGEIPRKILNGQMEEAEKAVQWFKSVFGDDYYLELQRHEVTDPTIRANRETFPLQQRVNEALVELSRKHGVKLICTNDTHFVDEENAEAHDRLICLSTGRELNDPSRMLYTKQEWFKTQAEMNAVFADMPEALANTCEICDKVETYSIDHAPIMPNFDIPEEFGTEEEYRRKFTEQDLFDEFTRDENGNVVLSQEEAEKKIKKLGGYDKLYRIKLEADYLAKLTYERAAERYPTPFSDEVKERLNFELHIMKTMGFPGYFLIVQDYINVARNELGVSVGPGRGSAAGSAVAYCLGITQIDPIKYDLLFERFLNPDRISLPDIDVDFDDDGRGRVLNWVTKKYGEEKVAHIITYGTMATKLAIKDVARVEKLPLDISNRLCKLIPDRLPEGPDGKVPKMNLTNAIAAIPELQQAEASSDVLLHDTIRYAKMLEGNIRNTGVHACGTIICRDDISDWVPISTADDKETHEKLRCTQYEGSVIEETGLIKMDFLGLKTLSIIKEAVENIKMSLGIELDIDKIPIDDPATYQLYCDGQTVGTFQFESAGMQKYLRELQPSTFEDLIAMNALYRPGPMAYIPQFIKRKHGEEPITYDLPCMEKYLKANFPAQYMAATMSRNLSNITDITKFLDECKTMRVQALGPDVNESYHKFSVNNHGAIRFGLGAVKGVGEAAVEAIVKERAANGPFRSVYDFMQRVNLNACNRKTLENLILAGAFDSFTDITREQYFTENEKGETFIENLVRYGNRYQQEQAQAQNSLFGDDDAVEIAHPEPPEKAGQWSDLERLNKERDLIGIYISGHPLDKFAAALKFLCTTHCADLEDREPLAGHEITFGGIITTAMEGQTKNGKPYGRFKIEDYTGAAEITLFGDDWTRWRNFLVVQGNTLFITARIEPARWREGVYDFRLGKVEFLADVNERGIEKLTVTVNLEDIDALWATEFISLIKSAPGSTELALNVVDHKNNMHVALQAADQKFTVKKSLIDYLDNNSTVEYKIN